jgi:hypothetical protein
MLFLSRAGGEFAGRLPRRCGRGGHYSRCYQQLAVRCEIKFFATQQAKEASPVFKSIEDGSLSI